MEYTHYFIFKNINYAYTHRCGIRVVGLIWIKSGENAWNKISQRSIREYISTTESHKLSMVHRFAQSN